MLLPTGCGETNLSYVTDIGIYIKRIHTVLRVYIMYNTYLHTFFELQAYTVTYITPNIH